MTKNAVVFSGRNGLDFIELRMGVLRIPEVTIRIREAQRILDALDVPKVDLLNVVGSDDDFFFRNIKMKSLMAAVVQVGLYDRYCRGQRRPDFMVGNSNGDAAMMVGAGLQTFEDMVRASQALDTLKPVEKVVSIAAEPAPLLTGLSLTEYRAIEAVQSETGLSYALLPDTSMEMKRAIGNLHATKGVTRFITIGPAAAMRPADFTALDSDEIETLDSIELDPMLGWFWRGVRTPVMALA